jgi:hypothetical protein
VIDVDAHDHGAPSRACRLTSPCSTWVGGEARGLIRRELGDYLPAATLLDVLLVVTELLGDAVTRGCEEVEISVAIMDGQVIGGLLSDRQGLGAAMRRPGRDGLGLVRHLVGRWDVTPADDGLAFALG